MINKSFQVQQVLDRLGGSDMSPEFFYVITIMLYIH